ncbi:MAG TPA: TonB-dependent receptor [Paludibacteraceae bacterium]|nr:TonB-dependent receptor [Paludibacteraceae bacterium]
MKKLMLLVCLLTATLAYGQNRQISGTVLTMEDDEPVIGASILVKGTTLGTITDVDGKFSISIPQEANLLVFTYVGLKTVEAEAKNGMIVRMEVNAAELDEVIMTAYGQSTKKAFTGSAQSVKGEELQKLQVSNVSQSLEGSMAGVQVSSSSGQPGESASIRIRGIGSISASQEPLIVVDGIPYEGSLNSIPTQDIADLTVLKDAAANSMYGARGSNGVILITTKKGTSGKVEVNFESRIGGNMRGVPTYDIISNPADYYEMQWEAQRNSYLASGYSYLSAGVYSTNDLINNLSYNIYKGIPDNQLIDPTTGRINPNAKELKWKDSWAKDPFQTGLRQEYVFNLSGGAGKTTYYLSATYLDENSYIKNSGFDRFATRANIESEVTKWFKAGINLAYSHTSQDAPDAGGGNYSNIFFFSQSIAPIYPIYLYDMTTGEPILDSEGKKRYDFGTEYNRPYAGEQNPLATMIANIYRYTMDNLSLRGFLEFSFLKDFKFRVNASYDALNLNQTEFMTPIGGDALSVNGQGSKATQRVGALNTNQLLTYDGEFGEHDLNVLVGHEYKQDNAEVLYGSMSEFLDPANPEFSNAGKIDNLTSYTAGYRIQSFLSRVEYDYAEKYYFSASYRCDGSSYFAPKVRWGSFWSVGASWRMKEESWLKDVEQIHNLKIKASYGTQGNDAIGAGSSPYFDQYSITRVDGKPSPVFSYRSNPDLTWEKSNNFNIGFEMGLFDRLDIEADFFVKETKDMLYAKPLPISDGSPAWKYTNEMDMRNMGIEVQIDATLLKTRQVKWDLGLNLTAYKNALTRLPLDKKTLIEKDGGYQAGSYWRSVGGSVYDFYDYHYLGVNPNSGLPMYTVDEEDYSPADFDGVKGLEYGQMEDGTYWVSQTSYASRQKLGKSAIPEVYGGISTSLEAYGFDLSVQTAFQIGGYVYDSYYASLMGSGEYGQNWHKDIFKRWTPTNTTTSVPKVQNNTQNISEASDRWLITASYFSLRNITLGYTFPKKWMEKAKIRSLRLYVVGDNLALASARKGLDPRQSFSGSTGYNYSALCTVSGGISLGF